MNQSRGEVSAETVASTNEPLTQQQQHHDHHHHHQQAHDQLSNHHNNNIIFTTASHNTQTNIQHQLHQQLNPSRSLPILLARSLVAFSGEDNNNNEINNNDDQFQQQTALDKQQQHNQEQSFSDWWSEYWSRQPFPSGYTQSSITLLACLITTIIFLIVVGNLLVCIAIFTEKSLKPTQNWFIASLAVSDMLLGLVVMPFSLARELMGFWIFGPLWCDIHEAIDVLLTTASINTLCLISLDRYWSITQAVSYLKKRTPRRGAFMIAFVWIFSAAVSLPPLFGWKKQSPTIIANSSSPSSRHHQKQQQQQQHGASTTLTVVNAANSATYSTTSKTSAQMQARTTTLASILSGGGGQWDEPSGGREKRHQLDSNGNGNSNRLSEKFNAELATPILGRRQLPDSLVALDPSKMSHLATTNSQSNADQQLTDEQQLTFDQQQQDQIISNTMQPLLSSASFPQQHQTNTPTASIIAPTDQTTEYPSCQLSDDVGYVLYSALGSFYIPCAVMVFTYIKIFLAARSRARRAINKQSRSQQAANKRHAARRAISGFTAAGSGKLLGDASGAGALTHFHTHDNNNDTAGSQPVMAAVAPHKQPEPITKGKIVIVERKKSLAATNLAPTNTSSTDNCTVAVGQLEPATQTVSEHHSQQLNTATYSCSDLVKVGGKSSPSTGGSTQQPAPQDANNTITTMQLCTGVNAEGTTTDKLIVGGATNNDAANNDESPCTLTTSGAKQASPSALNSSASNDSSLITVMNASMAEVPVTRFNFAAHSPDSAGGSSMNAAATANEESRRAEALLKAISQVNINEKNQLLREVLEVAADDVELELEMDRDEGASVPDIVVERNRGASGRGTGEVGEEEEQLDVTVGGVNNGDDDDNDDNDAITAQGTSGGNNTNETCFMTIEEDSDMFDAQAGRTIMMIAGNASQKQTNNLGKTQAGIMMTMMPASVANNNNNQTVATNSNQPVVCNNMVCRRQTVVATRSASSYCGSSMTINDDDIDDCVDDELLTDDCNGYSVSCGLDQYCPGSSSCPHCQECEQHEQLSSPNKHLPIAESPGRNMRQMTHSGGGGVSDSIVSGSKVSTHHYGRCITNNEVEAQSLTGDDNLSLTEYRSQEDSSSIMGHDVLDATEAHSSEKKSKPTLTSGGLQSNVGARKKSSIGFRLSRLGSSVPLTIQGGGLLALASNQQQQQQQSGSGGGGGGGTRNLKALRQNFFLKLNQLTAKSVAKNDTKNNNKKSSQISPTGKSSAQSSGTSYEPSVDYATTSNIHSTEYHQETTIGDTDDYDGQHTQTSGGDCQNNSKLYPGSGGDGTQSTRGSLQQQQQQLQKQRGSSEANKESIMVSGDQTINESKLSGQLGGKSSPANERSTAVNNQLDKNDDRVLLLRDSQPDDSNKRLLSGSGSILVTSNITNGKSKRFNGDEEPLRQQRSGGGKEQISSTGNQMNHSVMSSTTVGPGGSGTNRAYLASDNERHKRKLAKARERRATLILGLIMAAFICSWLPFFTFYVLRALCTVCREYMPPRLEAFIFWAGYCNSAINPIIYTIFNRDFRKAFRKILFKCL